MRATTCLALLGSTLLWGTATHADVTNPTPYDYDQPPPPGREGGTYAFNSTGSLGPDCVFVITGTAKQLPNGAGTGGMVCVKGSVEFRGTGPVCALAPVLEPVPAVVGGPYTVNGDGTICENLHIIGSPFDGQPITFHTYVDPKGRWLLPTAEDIAYPCPGIVPNGQAITAGAAFKIGKHGDDPPGSGVLPCTNP